MAIRWRCPPDKLSCQQRYLIAIADTQEMKNYVFRLYQQTSVLHRGFVYDILAVMKSLAEEGRTMLIVTHEMRFARDVSSQVVFLHEGRIEEIGTPEQVFDNPQSARVKDFMASHQK